MADATVFHFPAPGGHRRGHLRGRQDGVGPDFGLAGSFGRRPEPRASAGPAASRRRRRRQLSAVSWPPPEGVWPVTARQAYPGTGRDVYRPTAGRDVPHFLVCTGLEFFF